MWVDQSVENAYYLLVLYVELATYDTQGQLKGQCVALDTVQRVSSPPWSHGRLVAGGWLRTATG